MMSSIDASVARAKAEDFAQPVPLHRGTVDCKWCGEEHSSNLYPVLNRTKAECWPISQSEFNEDLFKNQGRAGDVSWDSVPWKPFEAFKFWATVAIFAIVAGLLVWGALEKAGWV